MGELLADRVAIVSGGGQGIGRGIALAFATEGASVVVADLDGDHAEQTAGAIRARGAEAIAVPCDVRVRACVEACVEAAVARFSTVDVLVNTAISGSPVVPLIETTDEMMTTLWQSGPMGTFFFMQACYPYLRDRSGSVINFGSGSGIDGTAGYAAYTPAKEAIRALTKVAAREWGRDGIHVNTMCPYANSPLQQSWEADNPQRAADNLAKIPLGHVGDCEDDLGRAAVFLASDMSRYVTGHTLMVDGGIRLL